MYKAELRLAAGRKRWQDLALRTWRMDCNAATAEVSSEIILSPTPRCS
jgi:hypothetical protein